MSDQYLGEIRLFPFNFAPKSWAACAGQLLPISQNTALFSLLGINYGGDGRSTFGLPNLQGQVIVGQGQAPGLSRYVVGETVGAPSVTLGANQIPPHSHPFNANSGDGTQPGSAAAQLSKAATGGREGGVTANVYNPAAPNVTMSPLAIGPAGNGQPHNNLQPYLAMIYCIALQGVFPPRS